MIFIINRTDELLNLNSEFTEKAEAIVDGEPTSITQEATIWLRLPNGGRVNLLHTVDPAIIKAIKSRFNDRTMGVGPKSVAAHDWYMSGVNAGYKVDSESDINLLEMITVPMNPSNEREIPRNVILGIFKIQSDSDVVDIGTCDHNDTTFTSSSRVNITGDDGITSIYEFRIVAIKWVGWNRLKRPAYCKAVYNDDIVYFQMRAAEIPNRPGSYKDYLQKVPEEEYDRIQAQLAEAKEAAKIARAKEREPKFANANGQQRGPRKPFNGNHKPSGDRNNGGNNRNGQKKPFNPNWKPRNQRNDGGKDYRQNADQKGNQGWKQRNQHRSFNTTEQKGDK